MRARAKRALLAGGDASVSESFEAHVRADGARAAAWLVWKHRAKLRRDGRVLFRIRADLDTPPWFRVAVEALRRRQRWSVVVTTQAAERSYDVRWLEWGQRRRDVQREIQPALVPARRG